MKDFQISRNGYNKDEVMAYISELQSKIEDKEQDIASLSKLVEEYKEKEKDFKEKEASISIALTAAVEKAKQIEKSSFNVYNFKIEELQILYARWEKVLNEIVNKYPDLDEVDNVKKLLKEFASTIKSNLKEDFRFTTPLASQKADPMRELLRRMRNNLDGQIENEKQIKSVKRPRKPITLDLKNKQSELARLEEKSTMIKPIFNAKIKEGEKYVSPMDKFLNENADTNTAYASIITEKKLKSGKDENGFDLKEAVNPKEDLEEIMKSFDFFNNSNQN